MTPSYEALTNADRKLLSALKKSKTNDGYFELIMSIQKIDSKNLERFFKEFESDNKVYSSIIEIYNKMSLPNFRKKMRTLAQVSIRNQVVSGTATYLFIKNVASESNLGWIKNKMEAHPTSKKLKVLYFQKKFEDLCYAKKRPSRYQVKKLSIEYRSAAKKTSRYLLELCSDNLSVLSLIEYKEDLILKALRNSF